MEKRKAQLTDENRKRLKEWVLDLVKSSEMIYGKGHEFLGEDERYPSEDIPSYWYYLRGIEFSDDDYQDMANEIVKYVLTTGSPGAFVESMAGNIDVLFDSERSARWLRPFVGAERTSVAYERGLRLVEHEYYGLARAIMQDAADNGDEFCAMYLIENTLEGAVHGFRDEGGKTVEDIRRRYDRSSLAYETALALIRCGEIEASCHPSDRSFRSEKLDRAQDILRVQAESGDVKSAMYLIEQTLHAQYNERKGLK